MISKYNNTIHSAIKMKLKDAALKENTAAVYKALYEDYKPIFPYYKFNEGKAVIVERFKRTLKSIMYKYFTANNTHKYIDALDGMIKKYNNT